MLVVGVPQLEIFRRFITAVRFAEEDSKRNHQPQAAYTKQDDENPMMQLNKYLPPRPRRISLSFGVMNVLILTAFCLKTCCNSSGG